MNRIYLEEELMMSRESAHLYLKEKLSFPEYYGCNLDALYDCLTDICEDTVITVKGNETQKCRESGYSRCILGVLGDAAAENDNLKVIIE